MKRLISSCVLALSGTALLSASVMAAEPTSCQNVRMGVVNWTDVIATSAMTQVLLDGLGYSTKQTSASQQIIFAGIRDQRLDLFLGYWNPLMTQTITPFVDANQVKVLASAKPERRPRHARRADLPGRQGPENLRRHRQVRERTGRQDLRHRAWLGRQHPDQGHDQQEPVRSRQVPAGRVQRGRHARRRGSRRAPQGSRGVLRLGAAPDERQRAR
jgi:hypothetical protein